MESNSSPSNGSTPQVSGTAHLAVLFGITDYLVFFALLVVSAGIGVFHAYKARKQENSNKEFLMGGKSMKVLPVAISLIASFMSAVTLLGTPSEVYQYGASFCLIGLGYILVTLSAAYLYMPVFWDMQVASAHEYLEVRFNSTVRRLGSMFFIFQMTLYLAIVVYVPSLALAQVTGLNLYLSICLICFVCMFYTSIGGIKAIVWVDILQVAVMYLAVISMALYGAITIGGVSFVWEKAVESGRVERINWSINPTERYTFWSLVIGGYFTWITIYGCNHAQVQKYLCVKEISIARRALHINTVGLCVLLIAVVCTGLVIYAKYSECDPIRSGMVTAGDQLFPLFVMETMGWLPGLPGFFVAGIFSGSLSTVATGINSLAAITLEDFVRSFYPKIRPKTATSLTKFLSLFYGLLTLALVFVAQMLGNVLSATLGILGIVGGPLLGMFSLGMFFPWANSLGCFIGAIVGLLLMFFVGFGQHVARSYGMYIIEKKVTSIDACVSFANKTLSELISNNTTEESFQDMTDILDWNIFKISYMWFSALGCITVIVVGLLISLLTEHTNIKTLNPKTLSPGFHAIKRFAPCVQGLGEDYDRCCTVDRTDPEDQEAPSSVLLQLH